MNKTLAALIFSLIGLAGCSSISTQRELAKKIEPDYQRWEERNQQPPKTLEEIQQLQKNDIIYGSERKEIWRSPKEALTLGYGDCEEKAFAGAYFAGLLGYPRKIIAVAEDLGNPGNKKQPRGHAMTFLETTTISGKKKYGLLDQNIFFYPSYYSINELILDVNKVREAQGRDWMFDYWKVLDLDETFGDGWETSKENLWNLYFQFGGYAPVN